MVTYTNYLLKPYDTAMLLLSKTPVTGENGDFIHLGRKKMIALAMWNDTTVDVKVSETKNGFQEAKMHRGLTVGSRVPGARGWKVIAIERPGADEKGLVRVTFG